jgi:hypothetical protein
VLEKCLIKYLLNFLRLNAIDDLLQVFVCITTSMEPTNKVDEFRTRQFRVGDKLIQTVPQSDRGRCVLK